MGNASFKFTLYDCMVYACCIGFASFYVVCDELYDCAWNVCVCMFIVSKDLLISSATVIVRAGGAIWLNPFASVMFCIFKSLIGTDMTYHFSVDVPLRILSIYLLLFRCHLMYVVPSL